MDVRDISTVVCSEIPSRLTRVRASSVQFNIALPAACQAFGNWHYSWATNAGERRAAGIGSHEAGCLGREPPEQLSADWYT